LTSAAAAWPAESAAVIANAESVVANAFLKFMKPSLKRSSPLSRKITESWSGVKTYFNFEIIGRIFFHSALIFDISLCK
jgi:hypothetical protein